MKYHTTTEHKRQRNYLCHIENFNLFMVFRDLWLMMDKARERMLKSIWPCPTFYVPSWYLNVMAEESPGKTSARMVGR